MDDRYIMRKAAGWYWLIDTKQSGMPYHAPLCTNELGARIWELQQQGKEKTEIISILCKEYEAQEELLTRDVEQFLLWFSNKDKRS